MNDAEHVEQLSTQSSNALSQHDENDEREEPGVLGRRSTLEHISSVAVDSAPPDLPDTEAMSRVSSGPAYSAFSPATKRWITIMITVGSFMSPVTANIYFPALNPIAEDLNVSTNMINLTLTTYMILQGLAPTLFGDFGDMAGRRPAYILAFSIYLFANIGLAVQRNYVALMVLRCVQSAGSSGTIALGYAVIADIASTAERGRYMSYIGVGINVGPAIGPVLGGILSQYLGWPAIFWFLAIYVAVWLVPWVLTVPETSRNVVGNGSVPAQPWNLPWIEYLRRSKTGPRETGQSGRIRFPNPLRTIYVVFGKEMGLILALSSMLYLGFILVAATLATIFKDIYGYNDLQVGLCYLPYGFGCCLAVFAQGYILDWNYRRIAKKLSFTIDRRRGADLSKFPIETARVQTIYPALLIGGGVLTGYGWSLERRTGVAVPLVLVFMIGMLIPTSFSALNTLIVDLHPTAPATATAANNLVRCLVGAAATAIIEFVIAGLGKGWAFTILGILTMLCIPGLLVIERKGPVWRAERRQRGEKGHS
jgi:multidrug resistance protein